MVQDEYTLGEDQTTEGGGDEEEEAQVVTADLSKADLIPAEGTYRLEAVSANQRMSKAGNPMIVIGYEVVEDGFGGEYIGCFLYDNLMLSGPRTKVTAIAVRAMLGEVPPPGWSVARLLGAQVLVELEQDESEQYGVSARVARYLED